MLHSQSFHQLRFAPHGRCPAAASSEGPGAAGLERARRAGPEHPGFDQDSQLESYHGSTNPHTFCQKPVFIWTEILKGLETVG